MQSRRVFLSMGSLAGGVMAQAPGSAETRVEVRDQSGAPVSDAAVTWLEHMTVQHTAGTVAAFGKTDKAGVTVGKLKKGVRYTVEVRAYGFLPWSHIDVRGGKGPVKAVLPIGFFVVY